MSQTLVLALSILQNTYNERRKILQDKPFGLPSKWLQQLRIGGGDARY
jgi:hypothetical protein